MARILWGQTSQISEGVERAVLYFSDRPAKAWNGLISVTESPVEESVTTLYFDGVGYNTHRSVEEFAGTIEAFTYPEELEGDLRGKSVAFSYFENGRIHLVYNAILTPSVVPRQTRSADIEVLNFSWGFVTNPVEVPRSRPAAHLIVETANTEPEVLATVLDVLYGTESADPYLPLPVDLLEIFQTAASLTIIDHGDGTWSAMGPDTMINMLDSTTFQITTPSAEYIDEDTYIITSW